jgi:hypothetical protein
MNAATLTIARLVLILVGVGCFAWSLNTGNQVFQYVAIGCVAAALALRIVARMTKSR